MNSSKSLRHWQIKPMNDLLADADLCVKCGLCLPHCPTYQKTGDENESPRGRIALIQAWAGQQLGTSEKLLEHIDNCLLCRSCERVCPAVVPYGQLIDNFRSRVYPTKKPSLAFSIVKKFTRDQSAQAAIRSGLKLYQGGGLQKTARFLKLPSLFGLQHLDRLLPDYTPATTLAPLYPAITDAIKGEVGLFTGCLGALLDRQTIDAAIKVLTTVGFNVYLPTEQGCCGALDLHNGDRAHADKLEKINAQAFSTPGLDAVITIASGCGSQLQAYKQSGFADKVMDISDFLTRSTDLSKRLKPLPGTIRLHTPCSLKNVMGSEAAVAKLLAQIPELAISPLASTLSCCGSAGSYMLEHPKMAKLLLDDVLDSALSEQADYLISSNIGCALHIAAGLRERKTTMEVLHPIVLIARQLVESNNPTD